MVILACFCALTVLSLCGVEAGRLKVLVVEAPTAVTGSWKYDWNPQLLGSRLSEKLTDAVDGVFEAEIVQGVSPDSSVSALADLGQRHEATWVVVPRVGNFRLKTKKLLGQVLYTKGSASLGVRVIHVDSGQEIGNWSADAKIGPIPLEEEISLSTVAPFLLRAGIGLVRELIATIKNPAPDELADSEPLLDDSAQPSRNRRTSTMVGS